MRPAATRGEESQSDKQDHISSPSSMSTARWHVYLVASTIHFEKAYRMVPLNFRPPCKFRTANKIISNLCFFAPKGALWSGKSPATIEHSRTIFGKVAIIKSCSRGRGQSFQKNFCRQRFGVVPTDPKFVMKSHLSPLSLIWSAAKLLTLGGEVLAKLRAVVPVLRTRRMLFGNKWDTINYW